MFFVRLRWISFVWLCLFVFSQSVAHGAEHPDLKSVEIVAHRGFHLHAPENSLASLQAAIDLGIDGSEVDLRTTGDGHLVLMHDATLERTTNGKGQVSQFMLSDLKKLFLRDKQKRITRNRIPTLEQALKLLKKNPGFSLALDMKQADPAQTAQLVVEHGVLDQVLLAISNPQKVAQIRAIQKINPDLKISVNILNWWKIEGLPSFTVKALGVQSLFASEWFFPRYGFAEAREAGAQVIVFLWGERELENRLRRAVSLGAQVVSSDRPDILVKELKKLQGSHARSAGF